MTSTQFSALVAAKAAIERMIAAIEQHHATNGCASAALFAEAQRHYLVLGNIRAALAETLGEEE